jgi:hypothetical protein
VITSVRARRIATAAAATVIALSTVATAAPANADSRTLKDGKGDTWNVSGTEPKKASGHPEADLRKVVIRHTDRRIIVTGRTQNLRKAGQTLGMTVAVDTASDATYNGYVLGERGAWGGEAYFSASDGTACSPKGSMNYRRDLMTLSFPRSCVGRPEWVRLQVAGVYVNNADKIFYDDPMSKKLEFGFTRRIEKG